MTNKLRFLILGDVVGRPGREVVSRALPELREAYKPDGLIVNVENISHGVGITASTFSEVEGWQADVYTLGDHAWDSKQGFDVLEDGSKSIIRPANYPRGVPGRGYHIFSSGAYQIAVINLQGQVFFRNQPLNPFHVLDELLVKPEIAAADVKLVDFHAEATSEKRGLGWHADGRVTAVWGTHTHVPTADAQVLPEGTGYITDIGMCGNYNSIIGVDKKGPLKSFLTQMKMSITLDDVGPLEVGGVLLEVDPATGKTISIAQIRKILNN
ncbi:MAG: TIGR00282 family metallophosphoesterase [bacterium]